MQFDPPEQAVLDKWGSEDTVYAFLQRELEEINVMCFGGTLTLPELQLKPMWLARGLMGERNSGADYEPAKENKPAQIGIFSVSLPEEHKTRIVLAHEMIHHWEMTSLEESSESSYPPEIDQTIKDRFPAEVRENSWRKGHSPRFISKACKVAGSLRISVRELLFG